MLHLHEACDAIPNFYLTRNITGKSDTKELKQKCSFNQELY